MDSLAHNPAARTWAVCTAILVLKMIASSAGTFSQALERISSSSWPASQPA